MQITEPFTVLLKVLDLIFLCYSAAKLCSIFSLQLSAWFYSKKYCLASIGTQIVLDFY